METEALRGKATCGRSHSWLVTKAGLAVPTLLPVRPFLNDPLPSNPHLGACVRAAREAGWKLENPRKPAGLSFSPARWFCKARGLLPVCGLLFGVRAQAPPPSPLFDTTKDSDPSPFPIGVSSSENSLGKGLVGLMGQMLPPFKRYLPQRFLPPAPEGLP